MNQVSLILVTIMSWQQLLPCHLYHACCIVTNITGCIRKSLCCLATLGHHFLVTYWHLCTLAEQAAQVDPTS